MARVTAGKLTVPTELEKEKMRNRSTAAALLALALIVPVPSIGAAAGLILLKGPVGQVIFAASKVWIIALPAAWLLLVEKGRLSWSRPKRGGFLPAALLGTAIAAAIFAAYFTFAHGWIDTEEVRALAEKNGLARAGLFIPMAFYWVLVNSLLEEYVWRWFVYTRCAAVARRLRVSNLFAVAAAALFFTLHHVVAIGSLFDWRVTALGCSGVFVGGAVWSWIYERYGSIWPCWLCHMIVDVPVFVIGWLIIFG